MQVLGNMMAHVRLVQRMARVAQVDLVTARAQGRLSQDDWSAMVQLCRQCSWSDRCAAWLDQNPPPEDVPAECGNRARLGAIKAAPDAKRAV